LIFHFYFFFHVNVPILPKIVGCDKRLRWKQALSAKEIAYMKEMK